MYRFQLQGVRPRPGDGASVGTERRQSVIVRSHVDTNEQPRGGILFPIVIVVTTAGDARLDEAANEHAVSAAALILDCAAQRFIRSVPVTSSAIYQPRADIEEPTASQAAAPPPPPARL